MTATFADMINEVSMNLSGYTLIQDRATYIKSDVTNTASTIAAPITLSLASSLVTLDQNSSLDQSYSLEQTCYTIGGCSATVTQN